MKELKPSGLFYVPVPMDAKDFAISDASSNREIRWFIKSDYLGEPPARFICKLPDEYWGIIVGTVTAEHIDFDPASVVESWKSTMPYDFDGYDVYPIQHMDYMDGFFKSSFSAYDSLRSLLTANDVHFVNPYGEEPDRDDYSGTPEAVDAYEEHYDQWLESESKLVEKILILKPL